MITGSQATDRVPAGDRRQIGGRRILLILGALGLLAALARLPLIRTPVDVSPDGCEYLGIARHLAEEGRWASSIKWHFFTADPVVHPALADRPPLFPLWATGWVALSGDLETQVWLARFGNLLLAAVVPLLVYWALCPAVADLAAGIAALIFLLYPAFLRIASQPLTEPLFLALLFGSLGVFLRAESCRDWLGCGLLAGLAFLTRPSGLLLPAVYAAALLFSRSGVSAMNRDGQDTQDGAGGPVPTGNPVHPVHPCSKTGTPERLIPLLLLLGGFLLPLLPYWTAVAAQTGSPFTSILRYNYSIRHIEEGTFYGFERTFQPPAVFVRTHLAELVRLIAGQWETMGLALGRSLQFLLPLALFWRPRGWGWGQNVLLGLALLNFLFHAMSWTVWGAARYMFPSYIIGMALLLDAPLRWAASERRRQPYAAAAMTVAVVLTIGVCMEQDLRLFREKARPYAGVHLGWAYAAAGDWLSRTPEGQISTANQPWIVNLLARRPAVMAPRFQDEGQLRRYLARYRPGMLTLFVTEREPEDVAVAHRLVEGLWSRPHLRQSLSDVLRLEVGEHGIADDSRQALLIFRVIRRDE